MNQRHGRYTATQTGYRRSNTSAHDLVSRLQVKFIVFPLMLPCRSQNETKSIAIPLLDDIVAVGEVGLSPPAFCATNA